MPHATAIDLPHLLYRIEKDLTYTDLCPYPTVELREALHGLVFEMQTQITRASGADHLRFVTADMGRKWLSGRNVQGSSEGLSDEMLRILIQAAFEDARKLIKLRGYSGVVEIRDP